MSQQQTQEENSHTDLDLAFNFARLRPNGRGQMNTLMHSDPPASPMV